MASEFKDMWIPVIAAAVGAVLTTALTPLTKRVWQAYKNRYISPQEAHREVLLEQARWYEGRATKLASFRVQLTSSRAPDRFELAGYVAKLEKKDREWAMKETDIQRLQEMAAAKGTECHDNADECARRADDAIRRTLFL